MTYCKYKIQSYDFCGLEALSLLIQLQGTPILKAIISDQYLGKYETILYSAFIYMAGVLILFCISLPWAIEHGAALGGLIAAMIRFLARGFLYQMLILDALDRQ